MTPSSPWAVKVMVHSAWLSPRLGGTGSRDSGGAVPTLGHCTNTLASAFTGGGGGGGGRRVTGSCMRHGGGGGGGARNSGGGGGGDGGGRSGGGGGGCEQCVVVTCATHWAWLPYLTPHTEH